jgi:hypothetical protein
VKIDGSWFKDEHGRTLILRGANLGGSTKVPYRPDGATWRREGFFDHHNVSFVGRPFPLAEADEHFGRLAAWGLTFLRFLITWEAVEHAGPGEYDEEYLDYLRAVIKKAGEHGIEVFIDPHQDVWSRFTGGDGAPGWTLEAVGFDITKLYDAAAAIVHSLHGDPFPRMIWPSNYARLGAATMFTLFFAGNDFAPKTRVDGVPVQEYLQSHYINAVKQVALRLRDLPNVVGYDSLNEPGSGFIGMEDLNVLLPGLFRLGVSPTPFQTMLLGSGYPQDVEVWGVGLSGQKRKGTTRLNPNGVSVWLPGHECVWKQNGVWTAERPRQGNKGGQPRLLRPDYFAQVNGRKVDFVRDYLKPFIIRFVTEIRSVHPNAILFLEGAPTGAHPQWGPNDPPDAVNAGHWYDGMTLFRKKFNPWISVDITNGKLILGKGAIRRMFHRQLAAIKQAAAENMNGIPTFIGEFGLPFDLDDKKAYRTGDFSTHVSALDAYYAAMDQNLLSCTIWNYTADNTNARGDQWNDEDLSIFSREQSQQTFEVSETSKVYAGGRGLAAIVRPYARKIAGEPLRMSFDLKRRIFELEFRHDPSTTLREASPWDRAGPSVTAPTEIFVPEYQYPEGYTVELSDGTYEVDRLAQTLRVRHTTERETHMVRVRPSR